MLLLEECSPEASCRFSFCILVTYISILIPAKIVFAITNVELNVCTRTNNILDQIELVDVCRLISDC